MQTASEFVKAMIPAYHELAISQALDSASGAIDVVVAKQEARDREVRLDERIATLREAARLVCFRCHRTGIETARKTNAGPWKHDAFVECKASALHDRIAELEAERDGGE